MNKLLQRSLRALGVALMASCFLMALPAEAGATSGVMRITSSTTLTANHTGVIVIEGNNIVLDCAYKYLYESTSASTHICGPDRNESCGILIIGRSNPTVKRCRPQTFTYGMYVESSSLGTYNNNRFEQNVEGVHIENSGGGTFTTNYYRYNTDEGIDINGTSFGNRFYTSKFNENGRDGADLNAVHQNRFETSEFLDNDYNGLECDFCVLTWVAYNTFSGNGWAGARHGLSLDDSQYPTAWENVLTNNAGDGLRVQNCTSGEFTDNVGTGNSAGSTSGCDARQESSTGSWSGNTWVKACPSTLQ